MKPTVAVLYGDAGSAALIHALKHWRQEHAPGVSYEDMFATAIDKVEVRNTLRPGGKCWIEVTVYGHRRRDREGYYFEATVAAGELTLESIT